VGCTQLGNLTSIDLPESVRKIDEKAFKDCVNLTSIVIPDSVTEIGASAFSGCTNLTSIIIPNSVKEIGEDAFKGCANLNVTCSPHSVAKDYCEKHEIHISVPNNMVNRLTKFLRNRKS